MSTPERPRAVVLGVQLPGVDDGEHRSSIEELTRLSHTLGLDVIGTLSQRRGQLSKGSVVGRGKLFELARWTGGTGIVPSAAPKAKSNRQEKGEDEEDEPAGDDEETVQDDDGIGPPAGKLAEIVVVDHDLTPSQARNLEKASGVEVMDRTSIILEIFQRHARSREARLQVEIARLNYETPRLREGVQKDVGRQRGGGRGSGQTAHELDRRRVRDRIAELRREIEQIQEGSETRRSKRSEAPTIALVGYTNAGKSSLMRRLTGSDVLVADKLFATLDTTIRALYPPTKPRILVSDTVGFIKKLPHDLVASFRSTLDEAREADVLLHVLDASDPAFPQHRAVTEEVLTEIGAVEASRWILLNKVDRLSAADRERLAAQYPDAILLSALDANDITALHARILGFFERDMVEVEIVVPYAEQARVARIHETSRVISETYDDDGTKLVVKTTPALAEALSKGRDEPGE